MVLPTTFTMPMTRDPAARAARIASSVSAGSPDWEVATARAAGRPVGEGAARVVAEAEDGGPGGPGRGHGLAGVGGGAGLGEGDRQRARVLELPAVAVFGRVLDRHGDSRQLLDQVATHEPGMPG